MDNLLEQQESLESRLRGEFRKDFAALSKQLEELGRRMETMMKPPSNRGKEPEILKPTDFPPLNPNARDGVGILTPSPSRGNVNLSPSTGIRQEISNHGNRNPKLDFPRFCGENPRGWIRKCTKYFLVNPMSDYEKIVTASMFMDEKADFWYTDYVEGKENMSWNRFVDMVMNRFSVAFGENLIGEFNKLKQTTTVEDYQSRFEELRSFMLSSNRSLSEEYFVQSFLSGLKDEIRHMVSMLRPTTLAQAAQIARMQENLLEATLKAGRDQLKVPNTSNNGIGRGFKFQSSDAPETVKLNEEPMDKSPPVRRLNADEMERRRRRGLCFNCDEPFHLGHKCKKLFVLLGTEEEDDSNEETVGAEENFQISFIAPT